MLKLSFNLYTLLPKSTKKESLRIHLGIIRTWNFMYVIFSSGCEDLRGQRASGAPRLGEASRPMGAPRPARTARPKPTCTSEEHGGQPGARGAETAVRATQRQAACTLHILVQRGLHGAGLRSPRAGRAGGRADGKQHNNAGASRTPHRAPLRCGRNKILREQTLYCV